VVQPDTVVTHSRANFSTNLWKEIKEKDYQEKISASDTLLKPYVAVDEDLKALQP